MLNQLLVAKNTRTKKKKNGTNSMVVAFFCMSSSLTASSVRAFGTSTTANIPALFVRSSRHAISFSSATRMSFEFASDKKKAASYNKWSQNNERNILENYDVSSVCIYHHGRRNLC
mmetsp:Transcript_29211/g.32799  ORF Transcript_29211/g.32799 Transcript_29211/m.32799 type:complete len:116 (-) Transcript_29211:2925-3272(-)